MNFQSEKTQLETEFDVLNQQISETSENWDDPVQRRFYEQFINSLPKQFHAYIEELNKMDKTFEKAEENIQNLLLI